MDKIAGDAGVVVILPLTGFSRRDALGRNPVRGEIIQPSQQIIK